MALPFWLSLALIAIAAAVAFGLGVWWGKLHPKQATALLTEADRAAQAIKKVT